MMQESRAVNTASAKLHLEWGSPEDFGRQVNTVAISR